MANHVRLLLTLLAFASLACSGDEPGAGSGVTGAWTIKVDGVEAAVSLSTETAEAQADGGVAIKLSGLLAEKTVDFALDIAGGTPVTFVPSSDGGPATATILLGGSSASLRLQIGDTVYRGTSGEIVLTSYGTNPGEGISGSIDAGLVGVKPNPKTSAGVSGNFTLSVVLPAQSS